MKLKTQKDLFRDLLGSLTTKLSQLELPEGVETLSTTQGLLKMNALLDLTPQCTYLCVPKGGGPRYGTG